MENTENNSPKVKDLVTHYEQQGRLSNPKNVKDDLSYLAEKPVKNVTKELATYFNSSKEEIKNDASKIGKSENKEKDISVKDAQVVNNDRNQNGIKDTREHDRNNNSIPDKKERDLNQNGIDDKKEASVSLTTPEVQKRLDNMFSPGQYQAKEIPFKDLKTHLGLDEKQVLDKGKAFLEPLLNGGRTEMETHKIKSVNDMEVKGRLSTKDDKLHIHPLQPELKEGEKLKVKGFEPMDISKKELAQLNLGNAITKAAVNEKGTKEVLFLQKDKQNNEILGLPQNKLRSPDAVGNKMLSVEQKEQISKGKELTLKDPEKGNTTVKVDLTSNKGFSVYNERGMKENKTLDFYKKEFGNDRSFSNKEEKGVSREKTPERERSFKPDNQRSRGSNSRSR